MNNITMTKTTLNEANRGWCASANNSRFKGTTPVWVIWLDEDCDVELARFKTKRECVEVFEWAKNQDVDWNRRDLEGSFLTWKNGD